MADVMVHEKLELQEEVIIRLTSDEAQELFDLLGEDETNRADGVYSGLANEGFEHTSQEDV